MLRSAGTRVLRMRAASFCCGLTLSAVLACTRADSDAGPATVVAAQAATTQASEAAPGAEPGKSKSSTASRGSSQEPSSGLGDGLLVWESNRSGAWRIWIRDLAFSVPRALTYEGPRRQHCCPHISPDGAWVAYLSLADALEGYGTGGSEGRLRLIRADGTGDRLLATRALTLFENRAAVWRSDRELIYIRGDGTTVLHDLETDTVKDLYADPEGKTWLINSGLTHAVSGQADFSPYEASTAAIARRTSLGGCQPYFSHDGRWGFWSAGTGGPIQRLDLASGQISTLLKKSDPRIPDGLGYVYFPMVSRDGRLFAFAASAHVHDHFKADYEIFVAETDPETLELLGDAVRMTFNPATDRFPDVFLAPLPLGRHRGEAPFEVDLAPDRPPASGAWSYDFGDGTTGSAPNHVYRTPGRYRVSARAGDAVLDGQVLVRPARPPTVTATSVLREGRELVLRFDEEIQAEEPRLEFDSGRGIKDWSVGPERRSLIVHPAEPLDQVDRLFVAGVSDRAQRPNQMVPAKLEIEPALWPFNRQGLVFLWETGENANLVLDQRQGIERAPTLKKYGRAQLDHNYAMVLGDGVFVASSVDADYLSDAVKATNELAVEAVIRPAPADGTDLRYILLLSGGSRESRNFFLAQRGRRLIFSARVGNRGPHAAPEVAITDLPSGEISHVLVTYQMGRLVAYLNGERVLHSSAVRGGFFHWKHRPLIFGSGHQNQNAWAGRLEGVAIYSRFIEAEEARENYVRYQQKLRARPVVPKLMVEATLEERSRTPRLQEISPYREALSVLAYRVEQVLEGDYDEKRLRVAHWSILGGSTLGIDRMQLGSTRRLVLEPFDANRQLESLYLSETLESGGGELFFAVPP